MGHGHVAPAHRGAGLPGRAEDLLVDAVLPADVGAIAEQSDVIDDRAYASRRVGQATALRRIRAEVLLVGISSEWLFPAGDVKALAERMRSAGVRVRHVELESSHGHDGFLADADRLAPLVAPGLQRPCGHAVAAAREHF